MVFTAQKVKPLMIKETARVAAAINRVWSVNSDHQCAITSRMVFNKASKVGLPLLTGKLQHSSKRYTIYPLPL
jgi:hypothetical protein